MSWFNGSTNVNLDRTIWYEFTLRNMSNPLRMLIVTGEYEGDYTAQNLASSQGFDVLRIAPDRDWHSYKCRAPLLEKITKLIEEGVLERRSGSQTEEKLEAKVPKPRTIFFPRES